MPKRNDVRVDETKIYFCANCGRFLPFRLPAGLKGFFTHVSCRLPAAWVSTPQRRFA